MTSSNISKKEKKRRMIRRKNYFIRCVFRELMDEYNDLLDRVKDSMSMTVAIKKDNYHIVFEEFGKFFKIGLFSNGNVVIWIKEYTEFDYEFCFFEYSNDVNKQKEFIEQLRRGLAHKIMSLALEQDVSYKLFLQATWNEYEFNTAYKYALEMAAESGDKK